MIVRESETFYLTHSTIHFYKIMNNEQLYREAEKVFETIEDTVSHLCDEDRLSGEKVWAMVYAMSEAKLRQFPDEDF